MTRKKILFICTHNSARSQMAEGLLREYFPKNFEAFSAGTAPTFVNPNSKLVMSEVGIDIGTHRSKSLTEFSGVHFDYVVTVCDGAKEACPFFPGEVIIHKSFPDPSAAAGNQTEVLRAFRQVRDEIKDWIREAFADGGSTMQKWGQKWGRTTVTD
ncbi:arsenate reductase ArsC [Acidobacteriota bacterium]